LTNSSRRTIGVFANDLLEMQFITNAAWVTSSALLTRSKSTELFHLGTSLWSKLLNQWQFLRNK